MKKHANSSSKPEKFQGAPGGEILGEGSKHPWLPFPLYNLEKQEESSELAGLQLTEAWS